MRRAARARARCWRIAGALAAAVPLGTYLANLVPWWRLAHPAWWLYGLAVGWTLSAAAAALARPWRRDPLAPFGLICLATLALLGVDAMTGSRLAAGVAVRPVAARLRPLLRDRQRRARRLLRQRAGRGGLARPRPAAKADGGDERGRAVRGGRPGLARVRRQGGRDDRAGAVPGAADRRVSPGSGSAGGGRCRSRSAGWPCSRCSPWSATSSRLRAGLRHRDVRRQSAHGATAAG